MIYHYLHQHKILTFNNKLDESNYLVSTDESLSETHYISITAERAKELEAEWNTPPEPTLEEVRQQKLLEIDSYNKSEAVDLFYLDDVPMWYEPEKRNTIKSLVESTIKVGFPQITLWTEKEPIIPITLDCEKAMVMLAQLEVFAGDSLAVTQQHKSNILQLQTKEEIESYDYTVNYPEKLRFYSNENGNNEDFMRMATESKVNAMVMNYNTTSLINTFSLTTEEKLSIKDKYPIWKSGIEVKVGECYQDNNFLWECRTAHTTQDNWRPSIDTTSLWKKVVKDHAGTLVDPIPYSPPMEIFLDKYYSQNNKVYVCIRNSDIPLSYNLSELIGLYVELVS